MAVRGFLQCLLKLFNFVLALMGIGMVFYSILMLNEWRKAADAPSPSPSVALTSQAMDSSMLSIVPPDTQLFAALKAQEPKLALGDLQVDLPAPWFIYAFLGAGIVICVVTLSGAVAAETHSACCLSCYQFGLAIMLIIQILLAAYLFFDKSWDQEVPDDPTGQLEKIKQFVQENLEILKWFGLAVLVVQIIAIALAMILRAMHDAKPARKEDEEAGGPREPLVQHVTVEI